MVDFDNLKTCVLCGRKIPKDHETKHHLIPQSFKKTQNVIVLHKVCHVEIHRRIPNRKLAYTYNTLEKILEHKDIQKFIKWIKKRPIDYFRPSKKKKKRLKKSRKHK
jgi:5-methylcytosine-specific restriction endonuclease McrA